MFFSILGCFFLIANYPGLNVSQHAQLLNQDDLSGQLEISLSGQLEISLSP